MEYKKLVSSIDRTIAFHMRDAPKKRSHNQEAANHDMFRRMKTQEIAPYPSVVTRWSSITKIRPSCQ